jgi:hypothetical protein
MHRRGQGPAVSKPPRPASSASATPSEERHARSAGRSDATVAFDVILAAARLKKAVAAHGTWLELPPVGSSTTNETSPSSAEATKVSTALETLREQLATAETSADAPLQVHSSLKHMIELGKPSTWSDEDFRQTLRDLHGALTHQRTVLAQHKRTTADAAAAMRGEPGFEHVDRVTMQQQVIHSTLETAARKGKPMVVSQDSAVRFVHEPGAEGDIVAVERVVRGVRARPRPPQMQLGLDSLEAETKRQRRVAEGLLPDEEEEFGSYDVAVEAVGNRDHLLAHDDLEWAKDKLTDDFLVTALSAADRAALEDARAKAAAARADPLLSPAVRQIQASVAKKAKAKAEADGVAPQADASMSAPLTGSRGAVPDTAGRPPRSKAAAKERKVSKDAKSQEGTDRPTATKASPLPTPPMEINEPSASVVDVDNEDGQGGSHRVLRVTLAALTPAVEVRAFQKDIDSQVPADADVDDDCGAPHMNSAPIGFREMTATLVTFAQPNQLTFDVQPTAAPTPPTTPRHISAPDWARMVPSVDADWDENTAECQQNSNDETDAAGASDAGETELSAEDADDAGLVVLSDTDSADSEAHGGPTEQQPVEDNERDAVSDEGRLRAPAITVESADGSGATQTRTTKSTVSAGPQDRTVVVRVAINRRRSVRPANATDAVIGSTVHAEAAAIAAIEERRERERAAAEEAARNRPRKSFTHSAIGVALGRLASASLLERVREREAAAARPFDWRDIRAIVAPPQAIMGGPANMPPAMQLAALYSDAFDVNSGARHGTGQSPLRTTQPMSLAALSLWLASTIDAPSALGAFLPRPEPGTVGRALRAYRRRAHELLQAYHAQEVQSHSASANSSTEHARDVSSAALSTPTRAATPAEQLARLRRRPGDRARAPIGPIAAIPSTFTSTVARAPPAAVARPRNDRSVDLYLRAQRSCPPRTVSGAVRTTTPSSSLRGLLTPPPRIAGHGDGDDDVYDRSITRAVTPGAASQRRDREQVASAAVTHGIQAVLQVQRSLERSLAEAHWARINNRAQPQ